MNPVFIYQNEIDLDSNDKFTIEFIENNINNFIDLKKDYQYHICSLNCNIKKGNKTVTTFGESEEDIKKISEISNELLSKGAAFNNDIDYVTTELLKMYNLPDIAPQKYKLVLDAKTINDNSLSYRFYDIKDKRQKFAKIYSPFSHFKKGFIFKGEKKPNENNTITIQLIKNEEIKFSFNTDRNYSDTIENNLYRDYTIKICKDTVKSEWVVSDPGFHYRVQAYVQRHRDPKIADAWDRSVIPQNSIVAAKYSTIGNNFGPRTAIEKTGKAMNFHWTLKGGTTPIFFWGFDGHGAYGGIDETIFAHAGPSGKETLSEDDIKNIKKLLPDFSFKILRKWRSLGTYTPRINDILFPTIENYFPFEKNILDPRKTFMTLSTKAKYKDYLSCDKGFFFYDITKKLPKDIETCESIFDEKVIEIKLLLGKKPQIKNIPEYEQINVALYDESNIIEETFIQRINKKIQLYGISSIPFAEKKKNHIISLKNFISFRIKQDTKKHKITFSLKNLQENIQLETDDNKIHNFSILVIEEMKKVKINKEIVIEALQDFNKYEKLNPIEIKITDNEIFNELTIFKNSKVRYRFQPNSILFSSSVQEKTEVIILAVSGLNEAKDMLLNGKKIKTIGCIYTNEIEGWNDVRKKTSNWVQCKFSDKRYLVGAKHIGFEFITTRVNALIDFSLYLLDQNGKEITFASTEKKTPILNFSIQVVS